MPSRVAELEYLFGSWPGVRGEVVFVDDGSTDDSVDRLLQLRPVHFDAVLVRLAGNYGSHAALRAGYAQASGRYIANLSADGQEPVSLVKDLLDRAREGGADVVFGVREKTTFLSWVYGRLLHLTLLPEFPAGGTDVMLFNRKVKAMLAAPDAGPSVFVQAMRLEVLRTHVPYLRRERSQGSSKWTLRKRLGLFFGTFAPRAGATPYAIDEVRRLPCETKAATPTTRSAGSRDTRRSARGPG